jgi:hypothetical protein
MQLDNVAQQRFRLIITALQENKDAFELQLRHQTQQIQDIHQQTQQRVIDAIDDANATAESLHQETQINVVQAVEAANLKQDHASRVHQRFWKRTIYAHICLILCFSTEA